VGSSLALVIIFSIKLIIFLMDLAEFSKFELCNIKVSHN
jgi:hypothetical protein